MSYLVLARKYRPQTLATVLGQEHVTRTLANAIASGRVAHAILFSGPRGTGKTTVARILAKAMNCEAGPAPEPCNRCASCIEITSGGGADVHEIDGASNNSVDQVRELRENARYMPARSRHKIYIIDEVHMLTTAAFNALLKTLEEPPAHVLFFFATTEPHKIPITILSRCQRHEMRRVEMPALCRHLEEICRQESRALPAESLALIAREAGGSVRDALSLLDQVLLIADGVPSHAAILELLGVVDREAVFGLAESLLEGNTLGALDTLDRVYDGGHDLKRLYADLLAQLRDLCLCTMGEEARRLLDHPAHEMDRLVAAAARFPANRVSWLFDRLFAEEASVRLASEPRLALELIFIRLAWARPPLPLAELIEKLDDLRRSIGGARENEGAAPRQWGPPAADAPAPVREPDLPRPDVPSCRFTAPEEENEAAAPPAATPPGQDPSGASWDTVMAQVKKQHPSLASPLEQAVVRSHTAGRIEIELVGSEFHFNLVNRKKNLAVLAKIASECYGEPLQPVLIRRALPADGNGTEAGAETGALLRERTLRHPMVEEALRLFDGRVIDIKRLVPQGGKDG